MTPSLNHNCNLPIQFLYPQGNWQPPHPTPAPGMSAPAVETRGQFPSLVRRGPAPYAGGQGLFTTRAVKTGEVVLHLTDPIVVVPDDKHLGECCSGCMVWRPPPARRELAQERYPDPEVEGLDEDQDPTLVRCAGCTVVWYCGKVGG